MVDYVIPFAGWKRNEIERELIKDTGKISGLQVAPLNATFRNGLIIFTNEWK